MIKAAFMQPKTVLCLGAHADDIEIGCGGTLLKLIDQNPELSVHWAVFSGNEQRAAEARESAAAFFKDANEYKINCHSFKDSFFPYQAEAIKETMHELSSSIAPDLIFTHRADDAHQDHRILSELAWCAFRDHAILEYEIPKYEGDLGRPNLLVELSPDQTQRKLDHLMSAFGSQRNKHWYTPDTFLSLMRLRGLECNSKSRFAEGFYARKIVI